MASSLPNNEESSEGEREEMLDDDGAIHLTIVPQLHALMMAKHTYRSSCCPQLFERADKSWWNPRFDTDILEQQYAESSLPKLTSRFRYALLFMMLSSLVWGIFWVAISNSIWRIKFAICIILSLAALALLVYTYTMNYQRHQFILSCITSTLFMVISLLPFCIHASSANYSNESFIRTISPATIFTYYIEILLLVYTIIPLPLYMVISLCTAYSITFEVLSITLLHDSTWLAIVTRILLHISIHLIGSHIMIMNEVRMRGTFMSVGQSLLVRRQYELEKALKETMINSVMPPKIAEWLMEKTVHSEEVENNQPSLEDGAPILRKSSSNDHIAKLPMHPEEGFRPFNMNVMDNVSILFADIVGFTRMSSNKTAEHLVGLLNDLFGRFDDLCSRHGCEKINTLGDCYYAVSGCPEPRADHAECCVNMGLAMIKAIKQFDIDTNEDVNMRVGVHTGKVLCGIVGTMRFKFDVWSQDVTLANKMESTGKPGLVHISDDTFNFLKPYTYILEEGPMIKDHKTYFISGTIGNLEVPLSPYLPSVASSPCTKCEEDSSDNIGEKKSCSLPSMLDTVIVEPMSNESGHSNCSSDEAKVGYSESPTTKSRFSRTTNVDQLLRLKLTKFSNKSAERIKTKTSPLKKLNKPGKNNEKVSDCSSENGRASYSLAPPISVNSSPSPSSPAPPPPSPQDVGVEYKDPRKDSGIRSRRSSIQDQIFSVNGMNTGDILVRRVSDYFTASHLSIGEKKLKGEKGLMRGAFSLKECEKKFLQMRKQSDLQMIKCVQRERTSRSHVMMSPLSQFTLFFVDPKLEGQYRLMAHRPRKDEPQTLASTLYNTYFDILVVFLVYMCISITLFLLFGPSILWCLFYALCLLWNILIMFICLYKVAVYSRNYSNIITTLYTYLTKWKIWHVCGVSLLCLPLLSLFTNYSCELFSVQRNSIRFFCYVAAVSLINFCNFTQLNCWMKNILASVGTVMFLVILKPVWCPAPIIMEKTYLVLNETFKNDVILNNTFWALNSTNSTNFFMKESYNYSSFYTEVIIAYIMLLILVWLLNREFEIGYRLSFYGYIVAMNDKERVQCMKNQAEWLLHNIIPKHVVSTIKTKTTTKYSKNHKNVGVMFASIVNFNELYSEDYSSGKEFMRFLNELVADFDELLTQERFRNIEKIKTIGSTYMAASGLNPELLIKNAYPTQHISDLVDFAKEMFRVVDSFNQNMIGFRFILRIGLNCGDVTAGVIGTTKLFYDIWGDAVNIASRMDSTGVSGYIQVPEQCANILKPMYCLKHRGSVYVKGKDNMEVYLIQADESENSDERQR